MTLTQEYAAAKSRRAKKDANTPTMDFILEVMDVTKNPSRQFAAGLAPEPLHPIPTSSHTQKANHPAISLQKLRLYYFSDRISWIREGALSPGDKQTAIKGKLGIERDLSGFIAI